MAVVKPFQALRYDTKAAGVADIAMLICPPYDVIAPDAQQNYLNKSEYNVVRLELGKASPDDTPADNRYTRAAHLLQQWQAKGILVEDKEAAYYLYEQEFKLNDQTLRRRDLLGITRLEDPESGGIIPHEAVIPPVVEDRRKLLEATRTNISPIFCVYDDPHHEVEMAYGLAFAQRENLPLYQLTDEFEIVHRLWKITGAKTLAAIEKILATKKLYIADGHHRFAAALAYRNQHQLELDDPANFILMSMTSLQDTGLAILPLHRLISGVSEEQLAQLDESLSAYFGVEEFDIMGEEQPSAFMAELIERMNHTDDPENRTNFVIGMYGANLDSFTTLSLKSLDAARELMPPLSEAWQRLDVSILQTIILEGCLGLSQESLMQAEHISYARNPAEAFAKVQNGEAQRAFFLPPTVIKDMIAVADARDRMPAKSTFFYPKFITGLVMRSL